MIISIQSVAFSTPLCNQSIDPKERGRFYLFACAGALCGFFFTAIILLMKLLHARPGKEKIPSIISLNIMFIGFLSTLFFVAFDWNGVCIDVLG